MRQWTVACESVNRFDFAGCVLYSVVNRLAVDKPNKPTPSVSFALSCATSTAKTDGVGVFIRGESYGRFHAQSAYLVGVE